MTSLSHRRITTTTSAGVAGIKIIAAPSKQTEVFGLYTVIWNDLLSFLNCYKHMLNTDILRQAALGFFKPDEIAEGKMLLLGEFEVFLGDVGQFKAKRRTT